MKKILLAFICSLSAFFVQSQSTFGVLSYTLPEGWEAQRSGENLLLVKAGDNTSSCKIILYKQTGTVVDTEKKFSDLWAQKTTNTGTGIQKLIVPVKTEGDGWISITATKKITNTSPALTEGFFVLCDGSKTIAILTIAGDADCLKEIQRIMETFNVPVKDTGSKLRAKTKKTKFPYVYRA